MSDPATHQIEKDAISVSDRHDWARLNKLQLGKYAEYLVKMEFVLYKCDVFSSEVDDHGIDFVIRTRQGRHYDVQVKSFRMEAGAKNTPYVFLQKSKFDPHSTLLLALVQLVNGQPPVIYLVRSTNGVGPNPLFTSQDLEKDERVSQSGA